MTTIFAKFFIIMTLVFEAITIIAGPTLYPVFTAAFVIITACLIIRAIAEKVCKHARTRVNDNRMFLLG